MKTHQHLSPWWKELQGALPSTAAGSSPGVGVGMQQSLPAGAPEEEEEENAGFLFMNSLPGSFSPQHMLECPPKKP